MANTVGQEDVSASSEVATGHVPWRVWAICGRVRQRVISGPRDRGDVPGWVLVTIMTAGLVVALWAIAGPKLGDLFTQAMDGVSGP
jgi:hypothetical protein